MRSEVSALMDGELADDKARATLEALARNGNLRDEWAVWHALGDSIRQGDGQDEPGQDFLNDVMKRLDEEPVVLAPGALAKPQESHQKAFPLLMPVAASLMGVIAVGWVALTVQAPAPVPALVATRSVVPAAPLNSPVAVAKPEIDGALRPVALSPDSGLVREYVMAHEGQVPRGAHQSYLLYQRGMLETGGSGNR